MQVTSSRACSVAVLCWCSGKCWPTNADRQRQFYRKQVRTPPQLKLCLTIWRKLYNFEGMSHEPWVMNHRAINSKPGYMGGGDAWRARGWGKEILWWRARSSQRSFCRPLTADTSEHPITRYIASYMYALKRCYRLHCSLLCSRAAQKH